MSADLTTSVSRPEPPAARRVPAERTFHGDTVIDDYAWLADSGDPETIAFLTAQNAFSDAITAGQAPLREKIFGEIKSGQISNIPSTVP